MSVNLLQKIGADINNLPEGKPKGYRDGVNAVWTIVVNRFMEESEDQSDESKHMAIKALKQESCEDAISRQAAIDALYDWICDTKNQETIKDIILSLPPATPKQRWIPVSERLPDEIGTYITTVDYEDYEKHGIAVGQRYYHGKDIGWEDDYVIAWMPLPEPYAEESEEQE